jgi:VWFA-related protein
MSRHALIVLLAVTATASGSAQQPTFPSRVELVTVDAVVFDRQGSPVEGLTRGDFTVREDGRPQDVAAFEAVSLQQAADLPRRRSRISTNDERPDAAGRWFFLMFDDVNITQFATARARETIVQFIERALRPGDRVMIAPASGGSNWVGELPQDRQDLLAFVQRLQGERRVETGAGRIWDYEAMGITLGRDRQAEAQVARRYFENGLIQEAQLSNDREIRDNFSDVAPGLQAIRIKARQTYTEARSRLQVSLGTLERMAAALANARGRKTLLFFSEGFIMDTTLANFRSLLQAARNANVAVHFVDVRSPGGDLGQPSGGADVGRIVQDNDATIAMGFAPRESEGIRSVASETGGTTVSGTNLLPQLTRIANEGRAYYLLGYSPRNTARDGKFRKIEVTVNRPGVTVRARGGYFAASPDKGAPQPDPDKLNPDVRAALDSPFGASGIPMRLTSYVLGPQVGGKVQTLLVAEADLASLGLQARNGRYTAMLDSYVLVHDRERDALERNERVVELNLPPDAYAQVARSGLPLQREFALDPGRYQATVLVRDRATGILGSVRHDFEVTPPREFRITTPIVTDVVQGATPGQSPRPVPIARRVFKGGTRIAVAFEVLGARETAGAPQVGVAYTLRRSDGTQVAASAPQALKPNTLGQLGATIGILLPTGASGEHELHLSVRDEQAVRVIEHVETLEIVP